MVKGRGNHEEGTLRSRNKSAAFTLSLIQN